MKRCANGCRRVGYHLNKASGVIVPIVASYKNGKREPWHTACDNCPTDHSADDNIENKFASLREYFNAETR